MRGALIKNIFMLLVIPAIVATMALEVEACNCTKLPRKDKSGRFTFTRRNVKIKNSEYERIAKAAEKNRKARDFPKSHDSKTDIAKITPNDEPAGGQNETSSTPTIVPKPQISLIKALMIIQSQKTEIENLKAKVAELEAKLGNSNSGTATVTQAKQRMDDLYREYAAINGEYNRIKDVGPDSPDFERVSVLKARRAELSKAITAAGKQVETLGGK